MIFSPSPHAPLGASPFLDRNQWLVVSDQWREVEKMLGFIVIEPFIIREVEFFDQDHDHDDLLRAHPWFILPAFSFLIPNS